MQGRPGGPSKASRQPRTELVRGQHAQGKGSAMPGDETLAIPLVRRSAQEFAEEAHRRRHSWEDAEAIVPDEWRERFWQLIAWARNLRAEDNPQIRLAADKADALLDGMRTRLKEMVPREGAFVTWATAEECAKIVRAAMDALGQR